jgi:hypothetical protein
MPPPAQPPTPTLRSTTPYHARGCRRLRTRSSQVRACRRRRAGRRGGRSGETGRLPGASIQRSAGIYKCSITSRAVAAQLSLDCCQALPSSAALRCVLLPGTAREWLRGTPYEWAAPLLYVVRYSRACEGEVEAPAMLSTALAHVRWKPLCWVPLHAEFRLGCPSPPSPRPGHKTHPRCRPARLQSSAPGWPTLRPPRPPPGGHQPRLL